MPIYTFECEAGKEKKDLKMSVPEYVEFMRSPLVCAEHDSPCKRVFGIFHFRM